MSDRAMVILGSVISGLCFLGAAVAVVGVVFAPGWLLKAGFVFETALGAGCGASIAYDVKHRAWQ